MGSFKFKIYRCEWQVRHINVDQYGKEMSEVSHWSFGTFDEAKDFRPTVAEQHQYVKDRWMPIGRTHDYCEVVIEYKEVLDSVF